jgi:hypothetical protein
VDQRIKYKIENKKNSQRAALLARLDDCAEQQRECGILALGIEQAVNKQDWLLVERLTLALNRIRESQQKAKERAGELVDVTHFRHAILAPLLDAITNRIQEALPDSYETIIDRIESDLYGIHPRLQPTKLLEGPKHG